MKKKAIVAGATGLVGSELVKLLIQDDDYDSVALLVRRRSGFINSKIQEIIVDFDKLDTADIDFKDADVFCTLGTTIKKAGTKENFRRVDYEYPLALAKLAAYNNAKSFLVVTSMGSSSKSSIFYSRIKGELEDALKNLPLRSLNIFRPSLLLGERKESRTGEKISTFFMKALDPFFKGKYLKYRAIPASVVAAGMIKAAKNSNTGIYIYPNDEIWKSI